MRRGLARVVHVILMFWLTWLFTFGWLPLLRSLMDGASYEWGQMLFGIRFRGAGVGGDLWYLAVNTAIGVALLWCGWRRPNGGVRTALPLVLGIMFCDALYNLVTAPEATRFQGATLGIDMSIAVIAPVMHGLFLALSLWWALTAPPMRVSPMNRVNWLLIGAALLLLPLQYLLLRSGQGQESSDVAGVLMTIGGWLLLSLGLAPWRTGSNTGEARDGLAPAPR